MPAVRTHLFGWMPSGEDSQDVDLPQNPQGIYQLPAFKPSETNGVGNSISGAKSTFVHTFSPASTASSPSPEPTSSTSSSDQQSRRSRRGDPSWVARPRNPFIIFRCEYSKEHSGDGNKVKRALGVHEEKSLSKKAAEAWHQLSPEAKSHFKVLADQERVEHARQNPDYRFRPRKRPTGNRRKPRKRSGGPTFGRSRRRGKIPVAQDGEEVCVSSRKRQSLPICPAQQNGEPCVKGTGRRSASVPFRSDLPSQPPTSSPERSNSSSFDGFPFDLTNPETPEFIWDFYDQTFDISSQSDSPLVATSMNHDDSAVHYVSPLTAVASSLAGWNGEPTSLATFRPLESSSSSRESSAVRPVVGATEQFASPMESETSSQYFDYFSANGPCRSSTVDHVGHQERTTSISTTQCGLSPGQSTMQLTTVDFFEELERAQALHEYGLGLMERVAVGSSSMGYLGGNEESGSRTPLEFDMSIFSPPL